MKADKRADIVISWLERVKRSYKSGLFETAYFDAECARADLEDLKSDIFSRIIPAKHNVIPSILGVFVMSAAILFADVKPLSREISGTMQPAKLDDTAQSAKRTEPRKARNARNLSAKKKPSKPAQPVISPKKAAYDKIPYLIQAGRQAMRKSAVIMLK